MIKAEQLTKRYGDLVAIENITFELAKGEILGLLGPNGAGKSTTMKILTGYLPPTSGTAFIAGCDITQDPIGAKRNIGYLPEIPPLYTDMTTKSFLKFVAKIKGIPRSERQSRLEWVLNKCNLTDVAHRLIGNLSKGYRQRIGLAQALIHNPKILILDEPTIGLDPKQINEIRTLIKSLAGEHSIILSTHILPEVTMVCQRAIIINQGHLVAQSSLQTLTAGKSLEEAFLEIVSKDQGGVSHGSEGDGHSSPKTETKPPNNYQNTHIS